MQRLRKNRDPIVGPVLSDRRFDVIVYFGNLGGRPLSMPDKVWRLEEILDPRSRSAFERSIDEIK